MTISDLKHLFDPLLAGAVPMPELVRRVHGGHSGTWQDGGRQAEELARTHDLISERGRKALTVLESSWTGGGADAARAKLTPALKATVSASAAYQANARTVTDSAYAFDGLKSSLVPMPEQAPSRNAWDTLTPWDTDTEDQINQFRQLEEQNRQAYQAYERNMQASARQLRSDYGTLDALDGDITLEKPGGTGGVAPPTDSGTVAERGSFRGSVSSLAGSSVGTPSAITGPAGTAPAAGADFSQASRAISDSTSASSHQPPDPAVSRPPAAHQPTGFGPGGGQHATTGGPWTAGGVGRIPSSSTGGFAPTGGRPGAPGSGGGAAVGRFGTPGVGSGGSGGVAGGAGGSPGAGAAGPGRGSGAAPLGPGPTVGAQQARPGAGPAGAAGARGAMPMGAMGGAGRGGQGGDDSEHRNNYVQATDEAFTLTDGDEALRDPETGHVVTPPTIGG